MEQLHTGNSQSLLNLHNKTARNTMLAFTVPFFFITSVFASEYPVVRNNGIQEINISQQKNLDMTGQILQNNKRTISGKVTDENGDAVIGANVIENGTTNGTVTDMDGNFSLIVQANATLGVSYIGYLERRIQVENSTSMNIVLKEDTHALEEVVVVGYGTMDKKELTSAITHISSKDFLNISSIDPAMQMQGKVSGVSITNTSSGDPNTGASIQVRGISSRSAGLGPLIVIDGIPGGNLHNINSNDIASIDVLKDGAASAIYGTRGSNGVILVTTKKGSTDGKIRTEYNGYFSMDKAHTELEVLSADEFRKHKTSQGIAQDYGDNVDWMKEITRLGITQNHSLSVSGGSLKSNFRLTVDGKKATGIDIRSDRAEYGARLAFEHTTNSGLFKFSGNLVPRIVKRNNSDRDVFKQALTANPTMPIKDQSDDLGKRYSLFTGDGMWNPVEKLKTEKSYNEHKFLDWNLSAKLNLLPLLTKGGYSEHMLSTQVTIAQQFNDEQGLWFRPSYNTQSINNGFSGEAKQEYKKNRNETLEWIANYNLEKNNHNLGVMAGYSYQQFTNYGFHAENKNFTSDALTWDNLDDGTYMKDAGRNGMGSYRNSSKLIAFFGRVTYNYMQRYLLAASLRYEGSSKFGTNNKWGYFPAISAGWRLSDEAFMKGATWINDLKIRADLGVTGNQDFDSYRSLATYGGYGDTYYNGKYYKGWGANKNPNPNLKWEKAINWNLGIDFSLFDRMSGSFNYYHRKQQDMLGDYTVSLPPYLWDNMYVNVGTMRNTGFEIELNLQAVKTKDFSYNIGFVGTTYNNKFLEFSNEIYKGRDYYEMCHMESPGAPGYLQQIRKGESIGTFVMLRYAGIDDTGNWLVYNKNNVVIPIKDAVNDDKAIVGNGLPTITASLNNTFTYKNFDLSLYFRGAFGFDIFNAQDLYFGLQGVYAPYNTQRKTYTQNAHITGQNLLVDYFLEKGDYLKLDVLSLGYAININNKWIERIRLYGTVKNVFTITSYSGIDPAQYPINGLTPGTFDGNKTYFPSTTQFLLGAQISF